jgi:hypothetical protein
MLQSRLAAKGSRYGIVDNSDAGYDGIDYSAQIRIDPLDDTAFTPELIDQYQYVNCSETEQEVTGESTKSIEDTVTYEFKESVGGSLEVEGEANIFFAKAKTTVKVEMSVDSTQSHEHKESFELKTETPFKVEKRSVLTAQVLVYHEEATDVPFVAHLVVIGGQLPVVGMISVPMYRYNNTKNGHHFLTTSWDELGGGNAEWTYEGIECYVDPSQQSEETPLYRYYSGQHGHFFTTDFNELKNGNAEYHYEGIACFVFTSQVPTTVPLYRYWNGKLGHFYTTDFNELGNGRDGYSLEGVQCYVYTANQAMMNVTDLLPDEADRTFDFPGTFSGTSHVRRTEIQVETRPVQAGECQNQSKLMRMATPDDLSAVDKLQSPVVRIRDAQREAGRRRMKLGRNK